MALGDKAVLVELRTSQWTARKQDRRAAVAAEDGFHTKRGVVRATKELASKKEMRDDGTNAQTSLGRIADVIRRARNYHYLVSSPWTDRGPRLLPATRLLEYAATMKGFRAEMDVALAAFEAEYPALIVRASEKQGGLFVARDFPPPRKIRKRFKLAYDILPIPDAKSFRVQLDDQTEAELQAQLEATSKRKLAAATKDLWSRVGEKVGRLVENLRPDKEGGKIFETLLGNVAELVSVLPDLNLAGDPSIDLATSKLRAIVETCTTAQLKSSSEARARVYQEASEVLDIAGPAYLRNSPPGDDEDEEDEEEEQAKSLEDVDSAFADVPM